MWTDKDKAAQNEILTWSRLPFCIQTSHMHCLFSLCINRKCKWKMRISVFCWFFTPFSFVSVSTDLGYVLLLWKLSADLDKMTKICHLVLWHPLTLLFFVPPVMCWTAAYANDEFVCCFRRIGRRPRLSLSFLTDWRTSTRRHTVISLVLFSSSSSTSPSPLMSLGRRLINPRWRKNVCYATWLASSRVKRMQRRNVTFELFLFYLGCFNLRFRSFFIEFISF